MPKNGGGEANDRDKTCSKNWDTEKNIISSSLGRTDPISSPMESGQIERWLFDRRARKKISVWLEESSTMHGSCGASQKKGQRTSAHLSSAGKKSSLTMMK